MCRPQLNSVASALAESIIPFVAAEPKHAKKAKKERQAKEGKKEKASEEGEKVVAERFRTKLCRNFEEKGSCPYESRCMFAHGEGQLRTTEMNLRDGLVSEEAIRQFKRMLVLKARAQAAHIKHMQMAHELTQAAPRSESSNDLSDDASSASGSPSSSSGTYTHNPYGFKAIALPSELEAASTFVGSRIYLRSY